MNAIAKSNLISVMIGPLAGLIITVIFLTGCQPSRKQENRPEHSDISLATDTILKKGLRNINFLPYWVTNAQFAGYYVAVEKGIYEKYGLKTTIIPYKPFSTSTDLIKEGKVDFTALWLVNAIEMKARGIDIVNIAQPSVRSSAMLITKKKSGIDSLHKMNGKRAGIWSGYELQPKALFNKYNLQVKIIPIGNTNNLFLNNGVDITIANWFDEYHSIINSGYDPGDLNVFFFADYGLNFLEDGIYCLSDKLKKDPDQCKNFVLATLEGWRYAFAHREEAIEIVLKYAKRDNLPVNRIHQQWMLDRYKDLYLPGDKKSFNHVLKQQDYQFVAGVLKEYNLIKDVPVFESFYQPVINP